MVMDLHLHKVVLSLIYTFLNLQAPAPAQERSSEGVISRFS